MQDKSVIIPSNEETDRRAFKKNIYNELLNKLPRGDKERIKYDIESKDRNLTEFFSIIECDLDDLEKDMWDRLEKYENYFRDKLSFNTDPQLLNEISKTIRCIKAAWKYYQRGNIEKATEQIEDILEEYVKEKFFVSELGSSYATKQFAKYDQLKNEKEDNSKMEQHQITLYRGRISEEPLRERRQMLHRPYKKFEKIQRQRFTCEGMPALYLASTSYACWLELNKPQENFYVSVFIPDECGEKLSILNLVFTQDLINGVYNEGADDDSEQRKLLQNKMIALLPLVVATSYKNMKANEDKKEYIIPELVMRSLKKYKIDGVAYISKHLDHDQQSIIGTNIAIPIYKEHLDQGYGRIARLFKMSEPELYFPNALERYKEDIGGSYICDAYKHECNVDQPEVNKEDGGLKYINTLFCRFDNRLTHKELKYYWEE